MLRERLESYANFFPWIGLILLIAGLVVWLITRSFDLVPNILVLLGLALLAAFVVLRPYEVKSLLGAPKAQYGTSAVLSTLFLAVIAGLLYWLALQNGDWRLDVTETGEFTPLPETIELLGNLEAPIHIIGFYSAQRGLQQVQAESLLQNLTAVSDDLTYEFKDPELFPLEAERYELNFDGTLVFTQGSGDNLIFSKAVAATDREIHIALQKVVNPVDKKLYTLTGHGELDPDSFDDLGMATGISYLEDLGFEVEPLSLFTAGEVPEDATVVALINQEAPMTPEEVSALRQYWQTGGAVFIARDAIDSEGKSRAEADDLAAALQEDWGVQILNDIIIDPAMAQAGLPLGFTFLGSTFGNHPIVSDDLQNIGVVFDLARSIQWQETVDDITRVNLVSTSDQAWGESNIELLATEGAVNPDPEDAQGEIPVGTALENNTTGAQLVVFGDTGFIANVGIGSGANGLLFGNAMNWLADDEIAIDLSARDQIDRTVVVPETQLRLLRTISIWLGPVLMLMAGLFIRQSRRNRP